MDEEHVFMVDPPAELHEVSLRKAREMLQGGSKKAFFLVVIEDVREDEVDVLTAVSSGDVDVGTFVEVLSYSYGNLLQGLLREAEE